MSDSAKEISGYPRSLQINLVERRDGSHDIVVCAAGKKVVLRVAGLPQQRRPFYMDIYWLFLALVKVHVKRDGDVPLATVTFNFGLDWSSFGGCVAAYDADGECIEREPVIFEEGEDGTV